MELDLDEKIRSSKLYLLLTYSPPLKFGIEVALLPQHTLILLRHHFAILQPTKMGMPSINCLQRLVELQTLKELLDNNNYAEVIRKFRELQRQYDLSNEQGLCKLFENAIAVSVAPNAMSINNPRSHQ